MKRSPVYGFSNHIAAHQTHKPVEELRGESRVEGKRLTDTTSSKYEWNQALKHHGTFDDCGRSDDRMAHKCECGAVRDPDSDSWECCARCGATTVPEWR